MGESLTPDEANRLGVGCFRMFLFRAHPVRHFFSPFFLRNLMFAEAFSVASNLGLRATVSLSISSESLSYDFLTLASTA